MLGDPRGIYKLLRRKKKAKYVGTPVACGWAGAVIEKVTRTFD